MPGAGFLGNAYPYSSMGPYSEEAARYMAAAAHIPASSIQASALGSFCYKSSDFYFVLGQLHQDPSQIAALYQGTNYSESYNQYGLTNSQPTGEFFCQVPISNEF